MAEAMKGPGILVGVMSASKKPPPSSGSDRGLMGSKSIPEAEESSPDVAAQVSPEERADLGSNFADALKSGDGAAIYDALEAIVRSCKSEY